MKKMNFLSEVISKKENNVSLILLNKNQLLNGTDYLLEKILTNEKDSIVLVSYLQSGEEILKKFHSGKLIIVDCFSENKKANEKVIFIKNPNSLTQLQISVEKAFEKLNSKGIVIIDSLSILSIYNSQKEIGKFIYYFTNKIKLGNNSGIYIATSDSVDEEVLDLAKQFCDKVYDFSKLFIQSIEAK